MSSGHRIRLGGRADNRKVPPPCDTSLRRQSSVPYSRRLLLFLFAFPDTTPCVFPIQRHHHTEMLSTSARRAFASPCSPRLARSFSTSFRLGKPNPTAQRSGTAETVRGDQNDGSLFVDIENAVDLQAKSLRRGSPEYRSRIKVSLAQAFPRGVADGNPVVKGQTRAARPTPSEPFRYQYFTSCHSLATVSRRDGGYEIANTADANGPTCSDRQAPQESFLLED